MKYSIIYICLLFLINGCSFSDPEESKQIQDYIIKTGTVCGWCSKNDTLTINGNEINYKNYLQCSNINPSSKKSGVLAQENLNRLLSSLNFEEFKTIKLNSCNVCADGCDNWIYVSKGDEFHLIKYGGNEDDLNKIKVFIEILDGIKKEYSD